MSNLDNSYSQTELQQYTNTQLLPQAVEPPIESAVYKQTAADFVVIEQMVIDFSEQGEHLWLQVQKTGVNTSHLAKELAKWADIPLRDVGYSGIKDRHAVTTQWFSLRIPKKQLPSSEFIYSSSSLGSKEKTAQKQEIETVTILQQHWHHKKLNRGTHKANRFIITLREIVGDKQAIEKQLQNISKQGVPNYFGEQRFGRNGNNLPQVLRWFEKLEQKNIEQINHEQESLALNNADNKNNKKKGKQNKRQLRKNRETESILLSTARSVIFNQILAERVKDGSWQTGLQGEVFNLAGTGSVFSGDFSLDDESTTDDLNSRLQAMDIHPTAVLWGQVSEKSIQPHSTAQALESRIVKNSPVLTKLARGLEKQGLKSARRPLRLQVHDLTWEWQTKDLKETRGLEDTETILQLSFALPKGSFATSVLASLIQQKKI
ncbi:MAG: tRNA pseudouridine(13) synthase TruD [Pseudomonadales bacterium]|nr:MAG: tRNA pseudouridine(13) synthase TruD [Pseudomonadales bacterium]